MTRALSDRMEAIERFAADVSHEIKNPLTSIRSALETLPLVKVEAQREKLTALLQQDVRRLDRLITDISNASRLDAELARDRPRTVDLAALLSDIVDFASIEAGLMKIEKKAADLHAVLVSVLTLVDGRARERKVGLNFDCSTEIGWVDVDANRLKQALLHLLHNAVTFTPAGGRVTLAARDEEPNFVIKVCDTGLGIPKADQERILEPFERGTAAGGDYSGAGLGLSMVSRLIALHGGEMKITSRVGRGTTVICSLPRVASPEN